MTQKNKPTDNKRVNKRIAYLLDKKLPYLLEEAFATLYVSSQLLFFLNNNIQLVKEKKEEGEAVYPDFQQHVAQAKNEIDVLLDMMSKAEGMLRKV